MSRVNCWAGVPQEYQMRLGSRESQEQSQEPGQKSYTEDKLGVWQQAESGISQGHTQISRQKRSHWNKPRVKARNGDKTGQRQAGLVTGNPMIALTRTREHTVELKIL